MAVQRTRLRLLALLPGALLGAVWLLARTPPEASPAPPVPAEPAPPEVPPEPPAEPPPPPEAGRPPPGGARRRQVRVLFDGTDTPVVGATVRDPAGPASCVTDERGRCALDCERCLPTVAGPWLRLVGHDLADDRLTVRVTSEEPTGELALLVPGALDVELVRVDGPPLTDSFRCAEQCARTLPAGAYLLNTLDAPAAARGAVARAEVPERQRTRLQLDGPIRHRLTGRVVDRHGAGIAGATVTLSPGRGVARTDAAGRFEQHVGSGELFARIEADGFVGGRSELVVEGDVEREWRLEPATELVVRLVDEGGLPVPDAVVEARSLEEDPDGAERLSTNTGSVAFRRFGARAYLVTGVHAREAEGELRGQAQVRLEPGRPAELVLVLRPTGGRERLVVSVVDVAPEVLAAGLTVEVRCGELVRTRRLGTYRAGEPVGIDGLVAGGCTAEARFDGVEPLERAVEVPGSVVLRPE